MLTECLPNTFLKMKINKKTKKRSGHRLFRVPTGLKFMRVGHDLLNPFFFSSGPVQIIIFNTRLPPIAIVCPACVLINRASMMLSPIGREYCCSRNVTLLLGISRGPGICKGICANKFMGYAFKSKGFRIVNNERSI